MLIITATQPAEFAEARRLFELYQQFLEVDLCFQGFEAELNSLPVMYGPPRGALLLASVGGDFVGCVGLRDLGEGIAEMKRMYVLPSFQGKGIGKALTDRFIETATDLGYTAVRLDTLRKLDRAIALYKSVGFKEIGTYRFNPDPTALFMEKKLK
ncbi:MAG: GNAT family N-acetyltransferase [Thermodesulfobacteriota bacterium]